MPSRVQRTEPLNGSFRTSVLSTYMGPIRCQNKSVTQTQPHTSHGCRGRLQRRVRYALRLMPTLCLLGSSRTDEENQLCRELQDWSCCEQQDKQSQEKHRTHTHTGPTGVSSAADRYRVNKVLPSTRFFRPNRKLQPGAANLRLPQVQVYFTTVHDLNLLCDLGWSRRSEEASSGDLQ